MKKNALFTNDKGVGIVDPNVMLKVTALLYLREALVKEEYELCAELIEKAKSFGAKLSEIKAVLWGYKTGVAGHSRASSRTTPLSRPRF